jgi:hypothetical protein
MGVLLQIKENQIEYYKCLIKSNSDYIKVLEKTLFERQDITIKKER